MEIIKSVPIEYSKMRFDKVSSLIFNEFSRTQIKKWIIEGRILLNDELALPKDIVYEEDEIRINPISEEKTNWTPQDILIEVIDEQKDYMIINKQSNLIMHPGAGCNDGTLANGLLFHYPELRNIPRAGIVHRLDKDTSGLLLIAKTEKFRNYFVDLLQKRMVTKKYYAIVVGKVIGSFDINDPIGRDKTNRTKMSVRVDGKKAETFVHAKEIFKNYSLLDVSIKSGRTHQIRVHLSSKKYPIIGDKTYNPAKNISKGTNEYLKEILHEFPRQALHSYHLSFKEFETNELKTYTLDIPDDMKNLINALKKHI